MDAHFSTQTEFFFLPRDSRSATFQILVKGAGIANLTAETTPLLPSPKSTTSLAALSQNRAPKPHVAAIVQNNNNNKLKGETDGRGWDPHTWATSCRAPLFSSPSPSSSPHSVVGPPAQCIQFLPETAAETDSKKKKQREEKRKRIERMENGKRIKTTYLNLSLLFSSNAFGLHL